MTDHAELRRLAEAATPGPWRDVKSQAWVSRNSQGPSDKTGSVLIAVCGKMKDRELVRFNADRWRANAAFIAAANPIAILALLDEVERLRASLETIMTDKGTGASGLRGKL